MAGRFCPGHLRGRDVRGRIRRSMAGRHLTGYRAPDRRRGPKAASGRLSRIFRGLTDRRRRPVFRRGPPVPRRPVVLVHPGRQALAQVGTEEAAERTVCRKDRGSPSFVGAGQGSS